LQARDSVGPSGTCALTWYLDCTYRTWRCDMEVEEAVLPHNATMLSTWPSKYSTRCAGQGQRTQALPSKSRSSKREPPSSCPSGSCRGSHGGSCGGSPGGFWIHPPSAALMRAQAHDQGKSGGPPFPVPLKDSQCPCSQLACR
jgi:hypothetical protein